MNKTCTLCYLLLTVVVLCGVSCKNNKSQLPSDAQIVPNQYSTQFVLAYNKTDSFLLLKNPTDSNSSLGKFFWGKSEQYSGFVKIKSRNKLIALSAVFTGMIEDLGGQNNLIAVDETRYITSPKTVKRIKENEIASVAVNGKLNAEKLIGLKPDIVFTYFVDVASKSEYQRIEKLGIPVLFLQNYLENHPLARAEWLRVFGWLLGKPALAQRKFEEIATHYNDLKTQIATLKEKPLVLINAPFSGVWDAPGGSSFMSVLIEDAGGSYLWRDIEGSGRKALSVETAYKSAVNADIWINPGAIETVSEIEKADARFLTIKAVKNKQVYNSTKLKNESYGNAYWEYGVLRPDIVLQDLVYLFHPEYGLEHTPVFFKSCKF